MYIEDLRRRLRGLGAKDCHEARVVRAWVRACPLENDRAQPHGSSGFFPKVLRDALPAIADDLARLATVRAEQAGQDGSLRLLVELVDGLTVESVLLPRDGLCVSTQVGCAVGCVFCMTGRNGLLRQLRSGEIVAQVALARGRRPVRKVVFMGMGEPAHNLDNVLAAIDLLGLEGDIAHKNLVFSTVGDRRVFARLPRGRVRPALALSLHTTDGELRSRLLPCAPRIDPVELVESAEDYARATGYPIQYQWTLLEGVNDSDEEIDRLIRLLSGKYAMMNFIPFNAIDGSSFRRPEWEKAKALASRLRRHGIIACLRDSAGQDIEAGCGQLRARSLGGGEAPAQPR